MHIDCAKLAHVHTLAAEKIGAPPGEVSIAVRPIAAEDDEFSGLGSWTAEVVRRGDASTVYPLGIGDTADEALDGLLDHVGK